MKQIGRSVVSYLLGLLTSDTGIDSKLQELNKFRGGGAGSISAQNATVELAERSQQCQYPAVYVYCEKLTNSLKEKFAMFSGKVRVVVEVRCSQDRLEDIEHQLDRYVDAVCEVLDTGRGSWQDGAFYTGGYEVVYGTVRHGGKNFIKIGKISLDVDVSR